MRLILAVFLVAGGICGGMTMAGRYRLRCEQLLRCELLLDRMSALLSLEKLPTDVLMKRLSAIPALKSLSFLRKVSQNIATSDAFPLAFAAALEESCDDGLTADDRAVLARLGDLIGAYELEKQLDGIAAVKALVMQNRMAAQEAEKRHGKTIRSLGILGGMAAAIFVL